MRKAQTATLKAGKVSDLDITADSPIPFDIRQLWYDFDRQERAASKTNGCQKADEELVKEGDLKTLTPAVFKPAALGSAAPFRNKAAIGILPQMNRLYTRLRDKRFEFLCLPGDVDGVKNDLHDLLRTWIDHANSITVFDLAGVPFEIVDLVVSMISRIVFEVSFWGREIPGIGRQDPILLVFEEAQTYLPRAEGGRFIQGFAKRAAHRIFKEGRKYGVGGLVVSQRPSILMKRSWLSAGLFSH